jgi:Uma2 family endonuclease
MFEMALLHPKTGIRIRSRRRIWTRSEFRRAEDIGLFNPEKLVELIEGEVIVRDKYVKAPYAAAQRRTERLLREAVPAGFQVSGQLPLALGRKSDPIPDIAVVRVSADDYAEEHPTIALLVVEISDSSLRFDQTTKLGLYALHEVPEYWILNLKERTLEVYRKPVPSSSGEFGFRYADVSVYSEGQSITATIAPEMRIAVSDLLPPIRKR